jgi:hypothetical protein
MPALLVFLTLLAAVLIAAVVADLRRRRRIIAGRGISAELARAAASAPRGQRFTSGSGGI